MSQINKESFNDADQYAVSGTSALKLSTAPKRAPAPAPQKLPAQKPQQEPRRQPARLPAIPTAVKIQVSATILAVAAILLALVAFQAKIVDTTVENNTIQRSIDKLNADIELLEGEADSKVVIDDVMDYINENGLIKPSENNIIKVNP